MSNTFESITFDLPKNQSNVIKVIGVGGGGSNAINHMFNQGIKGVDFVVCNTDHQALQSSPVPTKIQLGVTLTEGLGAGANPEIGQQSALESIEEIEKLLDSNTKMVFITAGMGGGTGTGAAPVIAKLAKDRDILTVGIVTIPFQFEGKQRQEQALKGVENLRANVDSLIVINNNKLREVYGNLGFKAGFSKADEVLATASRGIAEVITHHYTQNIDLKDAKTVLSNSGTAIMGSSTASGDNRAKEAIVSALDSPLLNDNKIKGAKNVLLLIVSGENEITIDEIGEINDHIQNEAGYNANIIMGVGEDLELGDSIAVTVIATGFNVEQQKEIFTGSSEANKIIHVLGDEQKAVQDLTQQQNIPLSVPTPDQPLNPTFQTSVSSQKIVYSLEDDEKLGNDDFEKKTLVQTNEVAHAVAPSVEKPVENKQVISNIEQEVKIKTVDIRDIEVVEPEFVIYSPQPIATAVVEPAKSQQVVEQAPIEFTFNIKEQQQAFESEEQTQMTFGFSNAPSMTEPVIEPAREEKRVVYNLDDYMEVEEELLAAKPQVKEEPIEEELQITVKTISSPSPQVQPQTYATQTEQNPMDSSIEEILRNRAEERKQKMKRFNHKFNSTSAQLNDLEQEPAYKRMGVDLHESTNSQVSRYSVGNNGETQLRSNNSFLHDNVD